MLTIREKLEVDHDYTGIGITVSDYAGPEQYPAQTATIWLTHDEARQLRDYLLERYPV